MNKRDTLSCPPDAGGFAPTRWTMVLAAVEGGSSSKAEKALAELCRAYRFPLYAYIRRRGHASNSAEDLTQEFFLQLLEKNWLEGVDREKGKFRAFLLAAMKNFLANQHDRRTAKKRGGGQVILSLDSMAADSRYRLEPAEQLTPERLFERQWALTMLDMVLNRLQAEMHADGKAALFDRLKSFLTAGRSSGGYADTARSLGMTEGAVKVAVHRLRRRYRRLLRDEIAQTVASPDEVDEEIRYLIGCL